MPSNSLLSQSLIEVSSLLKNKVISPQELLVLCHQRANATKSLNAYISRTDDLAKELADASEARYKQGCPRGPLDGIPFAIKDNFNVKGTATTCASRMLQNYVAPYTATVVQKLIDCGAVIVGKTNMDEFAMGSGCVDSIFGPTKNPWRSHLPYKIITQNKKIPSLSSPSSDDWYISGGSSGGSAVAVATGTCFGALSSDTGGSTRNPASRCGVVGFKPTYGLASRFGLIPLTHSMDVPGIMARSVEDVALILGTIAGHDIRDSTTVNQPFAPPELPLSPKVYNLRIGIPKEYNSPLLSKETVELWRRIADLFSNAGAQVKEVSMPHTEHSIVCYSILNCCEVSSNFQRYDGIEYGLRSIEDETTMENLFAKSRHKGFSDVVRGRILAGTYFLLRRNYEKYFVHAMKVRRLIYEDFQNVYKEVDLLLTPVTLTDSPLYSQWQTKENREQVSTEDHCTQPVNMAGVPAIAVPCSLSEKGLPLGLQIIGQSFKDIAVLHAAKWLEQQVNFPRWSLEETSYDAHRIQA